MYLHQQDPAFVDKKYDFGTITLDDQQVFIDEIFLPCFREAVWRQKTLRFPKDFEQAQLKGYTTTRSVDLMSQYDLMGTIQNMRDFLKENPGYSKFDSFYFLTYSFGGKQDYPLFFTVDFKLKKGDKIDVGFDFMARNFQDPYEKSILFFDKTSVQCLDADYLLPVGGRKLKFHPQFMSTFGGFQFSSKRAKRFEKVIMYSSLKYDFSQVKRYGRNNDDYHPYLLRSIPKAIDNLFVSNSATINTAMLSILKDDLQSIAQDVQEMEGNSFEEWSDMKRQLSAMNRRIEDQQHRDQRRVAKVQARLQQSMRQLETMMMLEEATATTVLYIASWSGT